MLQFPKSRNDQKSLVAEHYRWSSRIKDPRISFFIGSTSHPREIIPHDHDFYEMVFIVRGCGIHQCRDRNGRTHKINFCAGDLFAVLPNEIHWYSECSNLWLFNIYIRHDAFSGEMAEFCRTGILHDLFCRTGRMPFCKIHIPSGLFEAFAEKCNLMQEELGNAAPGYQLLITHGIEDLLIRLVRLQNSRGKIKSAPLDSRDFVSRVTAYIEEHLTESFTLDSLARRACLSKSQFCRRFKAAAGTTVWTYLTLQKLEKAKKLLAETSLDIDEIAGDCGFRDPSYFTRQFRKYFQETPVDYRRKHSILILRQTRNFKVRKKDLKKS